jgi:hypothetical protein
MPTKLGPESNSALIPCQGKKVVKDSLIERLAAPPALAAIGTPLNFRVIATTSPDPVTFIGQNIASGV